MRPASRSGERRSPGPAGARGVPANDPSTRRASSPSRGGARRLVLPSAAARPPTMFAMAVRHRRTCPRSTSMRAGGPVRPSASTWPGSTRATSGVAFAPRQRSRSEPRRCGWTRRPDRVRRRRRDGWDRFRRGALRRPRLARRSGLPARRVEAHDVPTWSWANITTDAASGANVIGFSTGYGDGRLSRVHRLRRRRRVASVVIDLLVVPWRWLGRDRAGRRSAAVARRRRLRRSRRGRRPTPRSWSRRRPCRRRTS